MYKYEDIAFRVIETTDLDVLRYLHNESSTYLNLLQIDFIDEENQLEWFKNLHKNKLDKRFVICFANEPNTVIGRLRIQNINHLHKNCEVGLDILPKYRGQNLGVKSYQMLLEFLFDHYNMNMVYLKVASFNPRGISVYEKVGFKETGRLPEYFYRYGRHWDYTIMAITKQEYYQIRNLPNKLSD